MSIFKRTLTTVYSHIDQMVSEIENHDALIKAAINEQRKKLASAKVQLSKVEGRERRIQAQLIQLQKDNERWGQRAVQAAASDEANALACMQRRKANGQQQEKLQAMLQEYRQTAARMGQDIKHCDEELQALSRKHELLRARQSTNEALTVINDMSGARIEELENSFERWETTILQNEILADNANPVDSLRPVDQMEQDFIDQENELELRAELAELLKEEKLDEH